jgi:hypothetical protein
MTPSQQMGGQSWAIIVGIDLYSTQHAEKNLKGCCNDAVLLYDFFRGSLGMPENNIRMHLSRNNASPAVKPDPPSMKPTIWNFYDSIDWVEKRASPGDLLHIHFSGHGTRGRTIYTMEKSATGQDERLCFIDNDMTDLELGDKLDNLAARKLILLVSLDCCFSGGATRWDENYTVRCMPTTGSEACDMVNAENQSWEESMDPEPRSRHSNLNKGWLYKDRDYNVIAACQPHEKSIEGPAKSGRVYGVLTLILVYRLKQLHMAHGLFSTTYAVFQGTLEAAMKDEVGHLTQQQPMLLGPRDRILFRAYTYDDSRKCAYVQKVERESLVINKGRVSGTASGDIYRLTDPTKVNKISIALG